MPLIAIDARYVRERPSGIGALVHALVRRIPEVLPDAEFLYLRHRRAAAPLSTAPNVREVIVDAEANGLTTLAFLPRVVDLRGVDLFHATFNILPIGLTMPSIATIHDLMWLDAPGLCRRCGVWGLIETAFYRTGIRRALDRASMILAVSEATRTAIGRTAPHALERTRVTPPGIEDAFRHPQRSGAAIDDRMIGHAPEFVLAVGQSAPYKNHEAVVRAFARAFSRRPSMHLVIVERLGPAPSHTAGVARALGVEERVHVLPPIDDDALRSLYRRAVCLCHPSFVEGWGMPIGEALASGCPVVTSNRSSMPEVAGDAALYVDPDDVDSIALALHSLSTNPALRTELIARGFERTRVLTWDAHVNATAAAYREVLALS